MQGLQTGLGATMKLGDRGPAVLAFQRTVFPDDSALRKPVWCDGICGQDTLLRWRADNDPTLHWILRRFALLIGKIITYSQAHVTETSDDCTGAACRVTGISKAHGTATNPTAWDFGTGGILQDALHTRRVWTALGGPDETDMAVDGDWLCYGPHDGMSGHIAAVNGDGIVDCSGSRGGVHAHLDDKAHFRIPHAGRPVYALRFIGREVV